VSSTSKVLLPEELASVTPIWWRDYVAAPPVQLAPPAPPAPPVIAPSLSAEDREHTERIERDAYQRGFADGKTAGKEHAAAELQPVLERLSRCLSELAALRPGLRRDAEKDLVKLSIAIARRVLHRELTLDPESIEGLIKVALDRLESRELCTVRVHPDQQAAIRILLDRFSNAHKIEMISDKSLRLGDVLLETAHGTIDASVDAQLSEIERGFADRLQK
jgi:flagellar assembly protein FliH